MDYTAAKFANNFCCCVAGKTNSTPFCFFVQMIVIIILLVWFNFLILNKTNLCKIKIPTGVLQHLWFLEPVFTICIGRFYGIKAWIRGKKRSKVVHLASIFNAVAAFLGH